MDGLNLNKLQEGEPKIPKQVLQQMSKIGGHIMTGYVSQHPSSTPSQLSTGVTPKDHGNDSPELQIGSPPNHSSLKNANQVHPKKKGGFVITSVKDSVDGDESADDLDESHASYSDVSYTRTTDPDHDQESSASEDTLNITVQDGGPLHIVGNQNAPNLAIFQQLGGNTTSDSSQRISNNPSIPLATVKTSMNIPSSDINPNTRTIGGSLSSASVDFQQDLPIESSENTDTSVSGQVGNASLPVIPNASKDASNLEKHGSTALPQAVVSNTTQQNTQSSASAKTKISVVSSSSITGLPTTSVISTSGVASRSASVSNTVPAKGGASRNYKVVKMSRPVMRERTRWTCNDYPDSLTPYIGFVAHSASDSRINFHDTLHNHSTSTLPLSMSSTSVPSSSSAYSLQHSDSTSSLQRDVFATIITTGTNTQVQHSASTSSVNYEVDSHRLQKAVKLANETDDVIKRQLNIEESLAGDQYLSEQEIPKNVMHSSGDVSAGVEPEEESTSSRNVRIDNKIEAAMDLVKKHLMLAVRDEVDELKDKIIELQDDIVKIKVENEALRGVLTPDQYAYLQPLLTRHVKNIQYQKTSGSQTSSLFQPQQSNVSLPLLQPSIHDVLVQPQLHSQQSALQPSGQKQPISINAQHPHTFSSMAANQPLLNQRSSNLPLQNQSKTISMNTAVKSANPLQTHSQQPQVIPTAQQQMMQKQLHNQTPVAQQQGPAGRQVTYQQGQAAAVYQNAPPQNPLTSQKLQSLRQHVHQVGLPMPQGQPGYQSSQVVLQQTGVPTVIQQPPVQSSQFQQGQGAFQPQTISYNQTLHQPQGQNIYTAQPNSNIARQTMQNQPTSTVPWPQPTSLVISNPAITIPSLHGHASTIQTVASTTTANPQLSSLTISQIPAVSGEQRPAQT